MMGTETSRVSFIRTTGTYYEYTALERLTKVLNPDNQQVRYTNYEVGHWNMMADSTGATTYAYDELNWLTQLNGDGEENRFMGKPSKGKAN